MMEKINLEVTGSCEKMGLAKQFLVSTKSRSLKSNQYKRNFKENSYKIVEKASNGNKFSKMRPFLMCINLCRIRYGI
jgi:hypothetical protein